MLAKNFTNSDEKKHANKTVIDADKKFDSRQVKDKLLHHDQETKKFMSTFFVRHLMDELDDQLKSSRFSKSEKTLLMDGINNVIDDYEKKRAKQNKVQVTKNISSGWTSCHIVSICQVLESDFNNPDKSDNDKKQYKYEINSLLTAFEKKEYTVIDTINLEGIPIGSRIIIPISMENVTENSGELQSGKKLQLLIEGLKKLKCDTTILIADTLQSYNCGYDEARKKGDVFIRKNQAIINDSYLVKKVFRWGEFIRLRQNRFDKMRIRIEIESDNKGSEFYRKMLQTAKDCQSKKDIESSIKLQKEEYALILAMSEFDYLLYPKFRTPGMSYLYQPLFRDIRKPQFYRANIIKGLVIHNQEPLPLSSIIGTIGNILISANVSAKDKSDLTQWLRRIISAYDKQKEASYNIKPFTL